MIFFIIPLNNDLGRGSQNELNSEFPKEIKSSGYWPLSSIHIDNNWTFTAGNYSWCSGSGTQIDPYVIQDVVIDGGNIGIRIENSNDYFILENNTVLNINTGNRAGLYLNAVTNGTIIKNNFSNNDFGIYFWENVQNNTFIENYLFGNNEGMGWDATLGGNDKNTFISNSIINSTSSGIYCWGDSNRFIQNRFSGTGSTNYGIQLEEGDNNKFIKNLIEFNINGLLTNPSTGNLLYLNWFLNNTAHTSLGTGDSSWNSSAYGNYWDDYAGVDADGDNIGDSPIVLSAGDTDYLPIWGPVITLTSPITNYEFEDSVPSFNLEIFTYNLDVMWYTMDNGVNNVPFTTNGTINQNLWNALSDGTITIKFYAMDLLGHTSVVSVKVIKSTEQTDVAIPFGGFFMVISAFGVALIVFKVRRKIKIT
jgi:parallel beta-helix repeat protein